MTQQLETQPRLHALFLAFGLATTGCVTATASVPEVEVTRENLTFQGIPAEVPKDIPADVLERYGLPLPGEAYHLPPLTFTYQRVTVDLPSGTTSDMHVKEVTIRAHEGSASLGFIRGLMLTAAKPEEPTAKPEVLFQYPAPGVAFVPLDRSLTLAFQGTSEQLNPWRADSSIYTLDVWADPAQLPRGAWAVDVVLVLSGSIKFEF
jgi:hypothetical protein